MTYSFDIQIFDSTFDDFNIDDHIEATRIKLLNTLPIPYGNYHIIQTEDTESVQTVDTSKHKTQKINPKSLVLGVKLKTPSQTLLEIIKSMTHLPNVLFQGIVCMNGDLKQSLIEKTKELLNNIDFKEKTCTELRLELKARLENSIVPKNPNKNDIMNHSISVWLFDVVHMVLENVCENDFVKREHVEYLCLSIIDHYVKAHLIVLKVIWKCLVYDSKQM